MLLKNTNPLGAVDFPLIGRSLDAGEEFEVTEAVGKELLKQAGNFEQVDAKREKK